MGRVKILTGGERRRIWSVDLKVSIRAFAVTHASQQAMHERQELRPDEGFGVSDVVKMLDGLCLPRLLDGFLLPLAPTEFQNSRSIVVWRVSECRASDDTFKERPHPGKKGLAAARKT